MATRMFILRLSALLGIGLLIGGVGFALNTMASTVSVAEPVVIISRNDCARLVAHQPSADVAYKPGVDVNGRPVVPADLPGSVQLAVPEDIAVDITVDIQRRYGISNNSPMVRPEVRVGTVIVKPDGSATFEGQPLTSPEQQALSALCQTQGTAAAR